MKELCIFDKVASKEYIIGLEDLIKILEAFDEDLFKDKWIINKGTYGYGELICSIEDILEKSNQYIIDGSEIFPVLKSGEQYFYNALLQNVKSNIEIGVHDSAYLFIRTKNDDLIRAVKENFKNVKERNYNI